MAALAEESADDPAITGRDVACRRVGAAWPAGGAHTAGGADSRFRGRRACQEPRLPPKHEPELQRTGLAPVRDEPVQRECSVSLQGGARPDAPVSSAG